MRWGGTRSKGEGRECGFDRIIFLHSDLLKFFLKQKYNITKFSPDTIVFIDENNSRHKLMG